MAPEEGMHPYVHATSPSIGSLLPPLFKSTLMKLQWRVRSGHSLTPRAVLWKLILFAVLMAVVPIGTYFSSLKLAFSGACSCNRPYRVPLPSSRSGLSPNLLKRNLGYCKRCRHKG